MNTGVCRYKQGIVAESKPGFARVKFDDIDGLLTAWLPVLHPKTRSDKVVWTLDVGEHVACLLDEYMESGCIVGAIYSDPDPAPVNSPEQFHLKFRDGTTIDYNRATHKLQIRAKGDVEIVSDTHITLRAPRIDLN